MFWRELSKSNPAGYVLICFIFAAPVILTGCGRNKAPANYLARVNESYLTEESLRNRIDSASLSPQVKAECSQEWIKNELLFREAERAGITKDEKFNSLLEQNKRELAATFFVKQLLDKASISCSDAEVQAYYDEHQDEFQLASGAFLFDEAYFTNERAAQEFRNLTVQDGWNAATTRFSGNGATKSILQKVFRYAYQTSSDMQYRLLAMMAEGELSLVFQDDPSSWWVIRAGKSYNPGDVPPLLAVRPIIESRILEIKKKEYLNGYIQRLYTSNKIEITPQ